MIIAGWILAVAILAAAAFSAITGNWILMGINFIMLGIAGMALRANYGLRRKP